MLILSAQVLVSSHNSLGDGQYFDVESSSSFSFDHITQKASNASSYVLEGAQADLVYAFPREITVSEGEEKG